jgi:hypothetical protein
LRGGGHRGADGCSHGQSTHNTPRNGPTTCPGLKRAECRHRQGQGGDARSFHQCFHSKPLLLSLISSTYTDSVVSFIVQPAGSCLLGVLRFKAGSCHLSIRDAFGYLAIHFSPIQSFRVVFGGK